MGQLRANGQPVLRGGLDFREYVLLHLTVSRGSLINSSRELLPNPGPTRVESDNHNHGENDDDDLMPGLLGGDSYNSDAEIDNDKDKEAVEKPELEQMMDFVEPDKDDRWDWRKFHL
jgi:hypothetical protein